MKKHLYSIGAGVCALALIATLVFFVITLLPVGLAGVGIKDQIFVSSSPLDAEGRTYLVQVRGSLVNENDEPITADMITLLVSDGKNAREVDLGGGVLETRLALELTDTWEDIVAYDRVNAVYITVNGERHRVENVVESAIGADTVVSLAVAAIVALVGVSLAKQRYYIYQEEKMAKG